MGKRGPGREPTKLKLLKGNPGKRALPKYEPQPPQLDTFAPPPTLSDAARPIWERNAPVLVTLGILTVSDVDAFAVLCEAIAEHERATREIATGGYTVTSDKGNVLQSPWVGIRHRAADVIAKYASRFGMTPSDRASLDVKPQEKDDFDAFLEQKTAYDWSKKA